MVPVPYMGHIVTEDDFALMPRRIPSVYALLCDPRSNVTPLLVEPIIVIKQKMSVYLRITCEKWLVDRCSLKFSLCCVSLGILDHL